jgi:pimeloyl-ACP methyl ester carboxylesterase
MENKLIDEVADRKEGHYKPYGWHHWPEYPWMSYQFRRALGETQVGGGAISECFQVASKIDPSDRESWHDEWLNVARRNHKKGDAAEKKGHIVTAQNSWLRAVDYYREAEFWLDGDDPRRLEVFDQLEICTQKWGGYLNPAIEVVKVPYENGAHLDAYFLRSPFNNEAKQPVLICFGGLDSFKDEMWFMVAQGAIRRGISVLMTDGPGQGGTIRRQKITTRHDFEVPVGYCIDYLETRSDIDPSRIAMSGSSLGGYHAARAASFEHRLAAAVSHGAIWRVNDLWGKADDSHGLAGHIRWVFGCGSMAEAIEKGKKFDLDGVIDNIQCPYLIVHGGYDVLGVEQASKVYEYAKSHGVDVTLDLVNEEETGAEHCQHDNPTLGQERVNDWLADVFGIDQRSLVRTWQ